MPEEKYSMDPKAIKHMYEHHMSQATRKPLNNQMGNKHMKYLHKWRISQYLWSLFSYQICIKNISVLYIYTYIEDIAA